MTGEGVVGFFLLSEGKLYRGNPVLGSLVIHSDEGTEVDLEGGD